MTRTNRPWYTTDMKIMTVCLIMQFTYLVTRHNWINKGTAARLYSTNNVKSFLPAVLLPYNQRIPVILQTTYTLYIIIIIFFFFYFHKSDRWLLCFIYIFSCSLRLHGCFISFKMFFTEFTRGRNILSVSCLTKCTRYASRNWRTGRPKVYLHNILPLQMSALHEIAF